MKIDKTNFFKNTKVTFKACKIPDRQPDYISKSGSAYWYGENKKGKYVIRFSDHWVNYYNRNKNKNNKYKECNSISSCYWHINYTNRQALAICGKAYFINFKYIDESCISQQVAEKL